MAICLLPKSWASNNGFKIAPLGPIDRQQLIVPIKKRQKHRIPDRIKPDPVDANRPEVCCVLDDPGHDAKQLAVSTDAIMVGTFHGQLDAERVRHRNLTHRVGDPKRTASMLEVSRCAEPKSD